MIETTSNKAKYVVSAQQSVYAFAIPFFRVSDIHCYLYDGVSERELERGSDFEVEVKEDYSQGAKVTLSTAITSGTLTIAREVSLTQDVSLPEYGKLPTTALEAQLDKLIMICQQLKEITERSFSVPHGMEDYDNDEIYKAFQNMVENVETWAADAQAGATSAGASAAAASGSSDAARSSAANAQSSARNAQTYASDASSSSAQATSAAAQIRTIAAQAALNQVTLLFGDWGAEGIYISYDNWTDAESLASVDTKIEEHDGKATAHSAAIGAHDASETAHEDIRAYLLEHVMSETAHGDIRGSVTAVNNRFNSTEIRALANTRCWVSTLMVPYKGQRSSVDHNLGLTEEELGRAMVEVRLKCATKNTGNGYEVGDYAQWGMHNSDSPVQPLLEANTVSVITGSNGISLVHKNNGNTVQATLSQWRYEFRIWY